MISYAKLWKLLDERGMKRTDLLDIISAPTLSKLGKNENVNVNIIEKLCCFLHCQPGEIMEYISEETLDEMVTQLDNAAKVMMEALEKQGISKEQFEAMLIQEIPNYLKELSAGESPSKNALDQARNEEK